ncbi:hypothetical protein [Sphingomonas sp. MS122]|uniref:hypothetical protein n=1 Tax=Sphingomonas sp. MS122 TaxID=3412683 RepID=UPI003C2EBAF6
MRFGKIGLILCALAGMFAGSGAMAAGRCGLVTVSGGVANLQYDPFSPAAFGVTITGVTLSRVNGAGGEKSSEIEFYAKGATSAQNGATLTPIQTPSTGQGGTGYNQNIFFGTNQAPPLLNIESQTPAPGVFRWAFSGNNAASDTFTLNFALTLPANLNLIAGGTLPFDIVYSCKGTGGGGPFTDTGVYPNAITVSVTVLSGLQASYVGTALDFGEVGDKTTAEVTAAPATYTTPSTNYVRVASSGPYSVALSSPNSYRLTYPGGNVADANQTLRYSLRFLGQTRSTASPTFTTVTCQRGGTDAASGHLPITATLLEGGQGKAVSPQYGEVLVVTVTPLVSSTPAGIQQNCAAL